MEQVQKHFMDLSSIRYNDTKIDYITSIIGGLNTSQDEQVIKKTELIKALNIRLSIDGIEPRPGSINIGSQTHTTPIQGISTYYKVDKSRFMLKVHGGLLYKKTTTGDWTLITGYTWNTASKVAFLQVRGTVLILSDLDTHVTTDGNTITPQVALTTPTGVTVTPKGTMGTTKYSYRISAFKNGETLASVGVQTTTGNATLSVTNYNQIDWTAVPNAEGYNVWGRKSTGLGETYLATVYTNTFNDTGLRADGSLLEPSLVLLPPEANTTTGIRGRKAVFAQSRIFVAGDPQYPSRLYYGGIGSNVFNFSFSETGGGATDIFKDDGSEIRDIAAFQGGVIVWKDNAIYKFYFNSMGLPTLDEITRSFGGISWHGSRAVENDLVFPTQKDNRLAFYSLGNQENYSAGILRTNELSIKPAPTMRDINLNKITEGASFYYQYIYGYAMCTANSNFNNRIWILDTRFGSWTYWEGIKARQFVRYMDENGQEHLYCSSDENGYLLETFREERNDNGVPIQVEIEGGSMNQSNPFITKRYYDPKLQFKNISQSAMIEISFNIDGVSYSSPVPVSKFTADGAGLGALLLGGTLLGDTHGGSNSQSSQSADQPVEIYSAYTGRNIKLNLRSEVLNAYWKLQSYQIEYEFEQNSRLDSGYRYYG